MVSRWAWHPPRSGPQEEAFTSHRLDIAFARYQRRHPHRTLSIRRVSSVVDQGRDYDNDRMWMWGSPTQVINARVFDGRGSSGKDVRAMVASASEARPDLKLVAKLYDGGLDIIQVIKTRAVV